ncbi:MAG: hypothetical protein KDC53_19240, partial [Saprospiraceae bacterium]|nr:hypothetical protein [Saprospiraceae bacterium]
FDHSTLLQNIFHWALPNPAAVVVQGPGILDVTIWEQEKSMTVHLVNFTNPMMLKGPFRELLPVGQQHIEIEIPAGRTVKDVKLLARGDRANYKTEANKLLLNVDQITDHEVIAIDFS